MKASWSLLVVLVLLVTASARVPAQQSSPWKWWQGDRARELGLMGDQSARIEEIFQASLPKLRSCNDDLERLEARLSDLIAASDTSEAEVVRQIDLVEASRSAMSKARTLMLFRMHKILTPEQRLKVKAMHEQAERDRRRPPTRK